MSTPLAFEPSSYWTLIKQSLGLYRKGVLGALLCSLIVAITAFIPKLLIVTIGYDFYDLAFFNPAQLWMIPINLVAILFFIGVLWHMYCTMRNYHEPFIEDIRVGFKQLISVFLAIFLISLIFSLVLVLISSLSYLYLQKPVFFTNDLLNQAFTAVFFLLQTLIFLYVFTLFVFLIPLIVIENKDLFSAVERSIALAWNHGGKIFAVQLTPFCGYIILLSVIQNILNRFILIQSQPYSGAAISTTVIQIGLLTLLIPWFAATLVVQLRDLELQKNRTI